MWKCKCIRQLLSRASRLQLQLISFNMISTIWIKNGSTQNHYKARDQQFWPSFSVPTKVLDDKVSYKGTNSINIK